MVQEMQALEGVKSLTHDDYWTNVPRTPVLNEKTQLRVAVDVLLLNDKASNVGPGTRLVPWNGAQVGVGMGVGRLRDILCVNPSTCDEGQVGSLARCGRRVVQMPP